jgi:hypothetical protein
MVWMPQKFQARPTLKKDDGKSVSESLQSCIQYVSGHYLTGRVDFCLLQGKFTFSEPENEFP